MARTTTYKLHNNVRTCLPKYVWSKGTRRAQTSARAKLSKSNVSYSVEMRSFLIYCANSAATVNKYTVSVLLKFFNFRIFVIQKRMTWLPKCSHFSLVHRCISDEIFLKFCWVVFTWSCWQTDRQTDADDCNASWRTCYWPQRRNLLTSPSS